MGRLQTTEKEILLLCKSLSESMKTMKKLALFLGGLILSATMYAQSNLEKVFKDEFNISGVYHLSKPVTIYDKSVTTVNFEFLEESNKLKVYYDASSSPFDIETNSTFRSYYRTCGVFFENATNFFGGRLMQLEEGVFIALAGASNAYVSNGNCDNFVFKDPNNEIIILGKKQERVKEISENIDLLKKLTEESAIRYCQALKCVLAGKYPFPEPGMVDTKLSADALVVVQAHATTAGWTQKIEYCYIKSKDWTILTDKTTGAIKARTIRMIAVMKNTNGACQWEEVEVKQDYNGSSYGKTYYSGNTQSIITVDCTEAMKHKQ
jgi:hypothetical protein